MAANTQLDLPKCRCGKIAPDPQHVVSRHLTSIGVVVYARCVCGVLHTWLYAGKDAALLARGARPANAAAGGGIDRS